MKMLSPNRVLKLSLGFLAMTIILCFLGFSTILKFVIRDQTALKSRNLVRKYYLKLPIPLDFRIYFFNISNPFEVQQGAKPKLTEVGPYSYDAYKEKIDILENEGEDSLTYTPYETYFFNKERSYPLSSEDYVTVLHPLIVGIVNTIEKVSPPLLPIVNRAIKSIFSNPESIYMTVKVKDFLFDGMTLNCNGSDFSAKAVCSQLKAQVPDLTEVQKNIYKFSILGSRNGTLPNRVKVFRGIKKSKDLGRLAEVNHEKEIKLWKTRKCNTFRGTDGWIFPPLIPREDIWSYSIDLCRNVRAVYEEDSEYHSIFVEKYFADLGDPSSNPEDKCYCLKTCPPKGVMDLTKCMGVPIYATLPHFLRADDIFLTQVEGLSPTTEEHVIRILMQPMLGVPLAAQKRMQLNLQIKRNSKINFMKTLPEALHPIFWLEEGVELKGTLLNMILAIFMALKVFDVAKYLLLVIGVGGVGFGAYLKYVNAKSIKANRIVPMKNSEEDKSGHDSVNVISAISKKSASRS